MNLIVVEVDVNVMASLVRLGTKSTKFIWRSTLRGVALLGEAVAAISAHLHEETLSGPKCSLKKVVNRQTQSAQISSSKNTLS